MNLVEPRSESTVGLADGRSIGIAEFGPTSGRTVLWFHGTPGARRQVPPAARQLAVDEGIRIVGIERPGVGASTPHVHRDIRGWTDDVEQVMNHLGIDEVGVVGLSGGGPYVLACANELRDRVAAAVVLGGVAPTEGDDAVPGGLVDLAYRLRRQVHWLREPVGTAMTHMARLLKPIEGPALELYARFAPEGDQIAFASPGMKQMFLDDLGRGAAGAGLRAATTDILLFTRPWGFSIRDIDVPVHFWHGDADNIVPLDHAQHMTDLVPGAELTVRPGESHLGTLIVGDDAIRTVLDLWDAR